jgi:hypothetical protein
VSGCGIASAYLKAFEAIELPLVAEPLEDHRMVTSRRSSAIA